MPVRATLLSAGVMRPRVQRSELAVPGSSAGLFDKILRDAGITVCERPSEPGAAMERWLAG